MRKKTIFIVLLFIATLLMSVGYASVYGIILDIGGLVSYTSQTGIYITNIKYISSSGTTESENEVTAGAQTLTNNTINLSATDKTSSITYSITVYNSTNEDYAFAGTLYAQDEFFYDNSDIVVTTQGINTKDELKAGLTKTFTVTFKYKDGLKRIKDSQLNAAINFKFSKLYTITYESITNNGYPSTTYEGENLSITFTNPIPAGVSVSGAESYSYTSPVLTITNVQSDLLIKSDVLYALDTYTFNGTSDYIDTGIMLFNDENINKDFEIAFTIEDYGSNSAFATFVNAMDETGSPWPGFTVRLESNGGSIELFMVANGNGNSNGGFYGTTHKKILLRRVDNVLYYQFDDGELVTLLDFTGMTTTFDVPLTIGASLNGSGRPFRYFKGTLSNLYVKFLE